MIELLRGTWRFRDFIVTSVKREFAARYLGTQLGVVWPIVHPLALILIYTLVFSEVMKARLPGHESRFAYSIYLTAGLITWSLFADLLTRSVGIFVHNAMLLKKVSVHKLAFPVIASLSALIQAGILTVCFIAFLAVTGNLPGLSIVAIVPVLAITALLAMGLGLFLATINVFYRDVEQTTNVVLQFWFWVTPVVYPISALPEFMQSVVSWNPMVPIAGAMQAIFVERQFPEWASLLYPLALAIALAFMARFTFGRLANELVDEL
jgi:lipopolysaccharide transport system permease protein